MMYYSMYLDKNNNEIVLGAYNYSIIEYGCIIFIYMWSLEIKCKFIMENQVSYLENIMSEWLNNTQHCTM